MSRSRPHQSQPDMPLFTIPCPFEKPDRSKFVDLWSDFQTSSYLESVLQWHGYIRFVSLPHLRENPDVQIDHLFVEPSLAEQHLSPDGAPDKWSETRTATEALEANPRLIVLGDPGSGKSTLINWMAWKLASRISEPWSSELDGLLPLPLVLREMPLGNDLTWDRLIDTFLNHLMCQSRLTRETLEACLRRGQACVMLDGLDEIGNLSVRESLRRAVFDGMNQYPKCRWLVTSRVVGYDSVAIDEKTLVPVIRRLHKGWEKVRGREVSFLTREVQLHDDSTEGSVPKEYDNTFPKLLYAAPFNDGQIERFVENWFREREPVPDRAYEGSRSLIHAIHSHEFTLRLARTPNLLTMMALVYRVKARLPDGRAHLYNMIAEAYLQSIDEYRKLREFEVPLEEKKRWLARVAFEMQYRRAAAIAKGDAEDDGEGEKEATRDILATETEVTGWITEAMRDSGYSGSEQAAAEFVDYIARRSGLLLPRGAGQFAFMHLSIQEYFAACYLQERVTTPSFYRYGKVTEDLNRDNFSLLAREYPWRETLIFLCELLATRREQLHDILDALFGANFDKIDPQDVLAQPAVVLLATLIADPHSGFDTALRQQGLKVCCDWQLTQQQPDEQRKLWKDTNEVFALLLGAEQPVLAEFWKALRSAISIIRKANLNLSDTQISDVSPLQGLIALKWLDLSGTLVSDISPLQGLTALTRLDLSGTLVSDISPLQGLTALTTLDLNGTRVSDISPLQSLTTLSWLNLRGAPVSDISSLQGLAALTRLDLSSTRVSDVSPLHGLTALKWLDLRGTQVSDVSPLQGLTALTMLILSDTRVSDVSPLNELKNLRIIR